jgi:hypothetical protein
VLISPSAISVTVRASFDSDKRRDALSFGSRLAASVSPAAQCSFYRLARPGRDLVRAPDIISDQSSVMFAGPRALHTTTDGEAAAPRPRASATLDQVDAGDARQARAARRRPPRQPPTARRRRDRQLDRPARASSSPPP